MPQDLCSFDDVERVLGQSAGSQMDSARLLELMSDDDGAFSLITDASREFEEAIGRTVEEKSETITVSGDGTNILILDREYTPVISISKVSYVGTDSDVSVEVEDADAGILRLGRQHFSAARDRLDLPGFPLGVNNIDITLTYGWTEVPQDIRGCVARMIVVDLLSMDQDEGSGSGGGGGIISRRLGDRSVTYAGGGRHANRIAAEDRGFMGSLVYRINRVLRRYGAEVEV